MGWNGTGRGAMGWDGVVERNEIPNNILTCLADFKRTNTRTNKLGKVCIDFDKRI
jgi:hypothetical protein